MFAQTPASHIRATKNGGGKHKCLSVFSHALLFPSPYARGNCTHNDKKDSWGIGKQVYGKYFFNEQFMKGTFLD